MTPKLSIERLARLEAMVDPSSRADWGLSHEDKDAIRAAIHSQPNPRLVKALRAVLLFYSAAHWDSSKALEW
jgi:hypothetical protein